MSEPEIVHRRFEQFVNEASLDDALALYDADAVLVERDGKIAVVVADWELEAVGPNGETIRDGGRTYDIVRQQEDGSWLLAVDNPWHVSPE